jgi:protein-L-isoaspartate(D-aspartate) O-methyltransferase
MSERAAEMVKSQIMARGICDPMVLQAMSLVPRHLFVPDRLRDAAYDDHPLAIGEGQTISQPYIVALMTESLGLGAPDTVLEIGTGSGYQAAVLSRIVSRVFTVEVREMLYRRARRLFVSLGLSNIECRHADGYWGWSEHAPYDAIVITAAVNHVPAPLFSQLKIGGRLIVPLGEPPSHQRLALVTRTGSKFRVQFLTGVMFVPMTGRAQRSR